MSGGQYDPAPWKAESPFPGETLLITGFKGDRNGIPGPPINIAEVKRDGHGISRSNWANAHLIAAAPELFEALNEMVSIYSAMMLLDGKDEALETSTLKEARAALAKARGMTA